jgi:chromosome segregation ATPase
VTHTDADLLPRSHRLLPRDEPTTPIGAKNTNGDEGGSEPRDEGARRCGYSACDRYVGYEGRGRPPRYCDRVWPDGQNCGQRAKAERAAARGLGVAEPLAAFEASTERLLPAVATLREALVSVDEHVRQVGAGALAHQQEQEKATTDALSRAERAASDAERARQEAVAARSTAQQALHERSEADRARLTAENRAADAEAAATRADARHDALTARHEELTAAHTARIAELATARLETRTAEATAAEATTRADRLATDLAAARTTLAVAGEQTRTAEARAAAAERQTNTAEDGRRLAERRATEATAALDQIRADVRAERTAAEQRAADHEAELTALRRSASTQVQDARNEAQRRIEEVRADTEMLRGLLTALSTGQAPKDGPAS